MKNSFQEVAINPNNSKWENTISRILPLLELNLIEIIQELFILMLIKD